MPVSSPDAAEMTKLLENIFRSVNIALVNELAMLSDRMDIDIWEVVDAAATKPFGFMRFDPGPGMGGHCLPVDPFYLTWRAREFDMPTEFIELAGEVNQAMPYFCVEKIAGGAERPLEAGARLEDPDHRRLLQAGRRATCASRPALKIIRLLRERGAEISYNDPYVPELPEYDLASRAARRRSSRRCDCAVIVTAPSRASTSTRCSRRRPLVVDFRGVTRGKSAPNLVRL